MKRKARLILRKPVAWALFWFPAFFFFLSCAAPDSWAEKDPDLVAIDNSDVAGEFFGIPVSMDNYRFAKAAAMIFGAKWGPEPATHQEREDRVWEDLLLSYEAFRRQVVVEQSELEEEIQKLLQAEKVSFDWRKDKESYDKWVKERLNEPKELFENQLKHLIQLDKLRKQVAEGIEPHVTEEEAYQKYLNQYNTLGVEFVRFDELKEAEAFYKRMKNPKLWEKEAKKNPKFALRPGFVSLEFLIEIWKIPKTDAYAMLNLPESSVYKPTPVYKGYGVFRTLQKRVAEEGKFPELRASYMEQVKKIKQYEGLKEWIERIKMDAHIKVFHNPAQTGAPEKAPDNKKTEAGARKIGQKDESGRP